MKRHIKKLAAPKTWPIHRRDNVHLTRPFPGPHKFELGTSLNTIFKNLLNLATNTGEVKKVLNTKNILINGVRRKDHKFLVGIFDTIAIDEINSYYRILLNKKGKISAVPIKKEESFLKPSKIIGKKSLRKKRLQVNLSDGINLLVDKDSYKTGDTLLLSLPDKAIKNHIKLDKNKLVFLTGGKHIGETGTVEGIKEDKIIYKNSQGDVIETLKRHAFVIGDEKPLIKLENKNE